MHAGAAAQQQEQPHASSSAHSTAVPPPPSAHHHHYQHIGSSSSSISISSRLPTAALSRALMAPSNARSFMQGQRQGQRHGGSWRIAGPLSLLLVLGALALALAAAVRRLLVRRVRACKACRGFGVCRCRLCDGQGSVSWRGKENHQTDCPLCLTKRYVTCGDCGGHYHRKMFQHSGGTGRGPIADFVLERT